MAADGPARERFIPFRQRDIVDMCVTDGGLAEAERPAFHACAGLLTSLIHQEFLVRRESLKDAYTPFNPDRDTRLLYEPDAAAGEAAHKAFTTALKDVIERANFLPVARDELTAAFEEYALFKVRLKINLDDFADLLVFHRGASERDAVLRSWFGWKKRTVRFVNYERVVIYVRFKDAAAFSRRRLRRLPFPPGSIMLKLFREVPKSDIEMLLPNAEVRMRALDLLLIGVPAAVSGAIVAVTKLGPTLVLIGALLGFWFGLRAAEVQLDQTTLLALIGGIGALGGYTWKQVSNFRNRKMRFLKTLAESLYFKNLDNNSGVFHRLIDAAEEEECKEMLLAFYFLLKAKQPLDAAALDAAIQDWFAARWDCLLDFDVGDALAKLERYGLAERRGDRIHAIPLAEARRRLDRIWDDLFDAATDGTDPPKAAERTPPAIEPATTAA